MIGAGSGLQICVPLALPVPFDKNDERKSLAEPVAHKPKITR